MEQRVRTCSANSNQTNTGTGGRRPGFSALRSVVFRWWMLRILGIGILAIAGALGEWIALRVPFPGTLTAWAAPGFDQVAAFSDTASAKDIGKYGMTPIYARDVEEGTYGVKTECSSPFFRILEAKLTVEDGGMRAVLTMSSKSYSHVFMGSAQEAAQAQLEEYIPLEEGEGRQTFTIPVEALNTPIACAAFSKNRQKWYGRQILFDASSLPPQAVAFPVPDYNRIEMAIRLYDREKGTDTKAELQASAAGEDLQAETEMETGILQPAQMEEPDGEYSIEVDLTGGSGRASVSSPTWLYIRDGKAYAKLLWSSSYYDYMIVNGTVFPNETTDGSNSTFTIPVTALDQPIEVLADTTAMGDPVEIEYALTFYADTVGGKGRVPQEAAKTVIWIALVIMVGGGIANYFVKKRRK